MGYLKRTQAPGFWPVRRKGTVFTIKSSPGPHELARSIPLLLLIRDILKLAGTAREAKAIIKQGKVLVDKKERRDPNFPIGLMDSVEIPDAKKYMRVVMGTKGLELVDADLPEMSKKLCRIQGKTTVKNGLQQLHLHDGRNILTEGKGYNTADSILLGLPEQAIMGHLRLEEGSKVVIISGKNAGIAGRVKKIQEKKYILEKNKVVIGAEGKEIETPTDCVMVIESPGSPKTEDGGQETGGGEDRNERTARKVKAK